MILIELSPAVKRLFVPHTKIVLIHDRCAYDGVLLEAFNSVKNDDKFEDRDVLTTIAAMGWEDCIPLQPADFLAYEVMKESQRLEPEVMEKKSRPIRKSLESLRAKESFLGATYSVSKQNLLNLRKTITEKAERRMAEGDE